MLSLASLNATIQNLTKISIYFRYKQKYPGGWGEMFRTRPDQPWGPPSLL
jgi:hypothetical protein